MRAKNVIRMAVAALGVASLTGSADAAPLLAVDFNSDQSGGLTETGFQGALAASGEAGGVVTYTYNSGNFTVKTAGDTSVDSNGILNSTGSTSNGVTARLWSAPTFEGGTFTYNDLYRDVIIGRNSGIDSLALQIYGPGLSANTAYSVTFYAYDDRGSGTSTFTNRTGLDSVTPGTTLGTISWTAPYTFDATTPNSIFSLTSTVTSDANGRLTFAAGASGVQGKINGFEIAPVPEPATLGLALGAAVMGLLARRRRQA
ncbi:MAG: PEP-CTERM sorting domain-containing protein [Lentisphaeria bacterium]